MSDWTKICIRLGLDSGQISSDQSTVADWIEPFAAIHREDTNPRPPPLWLDCPSTLCLD